MEQGARVEALHASFDKTLSQIVKMAPGTDGLFDEMGISKEETFLREAFSEASRQALGCVVNCSKVYGISHCFIGYLLTSCLCLE